MAQAVAMSAQMTCTFGAAPAVLSPSPGTVMANSKGIATIMDFAPNTNIPPFGMCQSLSNPQVASATSAAQGVLTPQPCVPATTSPWTPGATKVTVGGKPALTNSSKCTCMWGGSISIMNPGTTTVMVS